MPRGHVPASPHAAAAPCARVRFVRPKTHWAPAFARAHLLGSLPRVSPVRWSVRRECATRAHAEPCGGRGLALWVRRAMRVLCKNKKNGLWVRCFWSLSLFFLGQCVWRHPTGACVGQGGRGKRRGTPPAPPCSFNGQAQAGRPVCAEAAVWVAHLRVCPSGRPLTACVDSHCAAGWCGGVRRGEGGGGGVRRPRERKGQATTRARTNPPLRHPTPATRTHTPTLPP